MDKFIYILKSMLSGFSTGIVISIPLGPAGIESVKRTISKGYKEGFTVSLGALTADFTYLLLINCGLSSLLSKNKTTEALFWIICGFVLSYIGYCSVKSKGSKDTSFNFIKNSSLTSMPFMVGFLITFSNPLTLSLWLTLSGTVIRAWYYVGSIFYATFIISILAGMIAWFAGLNLVALKGMKVLPEEATKKTSLILMYLILVIGLGFVVFGFYKLFI